jgi:aminoglycoside phosphotransferase family enzyme/predicted kinase
MANGVEQPELVSAMLEPRFYPYRPASVELRETNTSWVFLAGELAYKVKKPVSFAFLDYGTVERRHEMCREEIRLNRRLAPHIYLGVVGIAQPGRYRLTGEDDPAAVEYAIEMRRVREERSLEALIRDDLLQLGDVNPVARRLATFHVDAAVAPRRFRQTRVLVESVEENLRTLEEAGEGILAAGRLAAARRFTQAFMAANQERIEARARGGLVRECHGDLRAEHVIVEADGEVYVYDCVEFNPELRHIDPGSDLSFLIMDLTRLGADDAASRLLAEYRRCGGDPGDDSLVSFFASFRAWVRAKVACLTARGSQDTSERAPSESRARELLMLGHRFAWRARDPVVLSICGVAGSGKTTLADALGAASGWPRVSSDLTRKQLAGVPSTERARSWHYSGEFTARTYREMGESVERLLERGNGVIVDATFHRREERDAFRAGLGESSAPVFVECRAPAETLAARVRTRESEPDHVSDADPTIVERQLAAMEPLEEIPAGQRIQLTIDVPVQDLLGEVETFVDRLSWGGR